MTQCNYCFLQNIRKHAASIGQAVSLKPVIYPRIKSEDGAIELSGLDVFIHPTEILEEQLEARNIGEEPPPYWAAWFAALPPHCKC